MTACSPCYLPWKTTENKAWHFPCSTSIEACLIQFWTVSSPIWMRREVPIPPLDLLCYSIHPACLQMVLVLIDLQFSKYPGKEKYMSHRLELYVNIDGGYLPWTICHSSRWRGDKLLHQLTSWWEMFSYLCGQNYFFRQLSKSSDFLI